MAETFFRSFVRESGEEVTVYVSVTSWGRPAQTYGRPEDCYEGDPVEAQIDGWQGLGRQAELTDAERERALAEFLEDPPEPSFDQDRQREDRDEEMRLERR